MGKDSVALFVPLNAPIHGKPLMKPLPSGKFFVLMVLVQKKVSNIALQHKQIGFHQLLLSRFDMEKNFAFFQQVVRSCTSMK